MCIKKSIKGKVWNFALRLGFIQEKISLQNQELSDNFVKKKVYTPKSKERPLCSAPDYTQ